MVPTMTNKPPAPKRPLRLERPLVFLDLETTGLNTEEDRIVEIAVIKINPDGSRDTHAHRVNPTIPIPPAATAAHGITDNDVESCSTFAEMAIELYHFITGCDLAGYNALAFDFPMLRKEFERCGIDWDYSKSYLVDVGNIAKIQNPRNLAAVYKMYCGQELRNAHTALADTTATADVFFQQVQQGETPSTIQEIAKYSNYDQPLLDLSGKFTINADGIVVFGFGQHRGKPVKENLDYVEWMYSRDFPEDTKRFCRIFLNRQEHDTF